MINTLEKEYNMPKFGYQSIKKMEPKPGRNYATEYYKQTNSERNRTQEHVERIIHSIGQQVQDNPDAEQVLLQPMKGFQRRETKGAYSAMDVISDMLTQLQSGKDIPSGMLGRWNRMFDGTGHEIHMVPESELPPPNVFTQVFDHVG
jgi:hypothetical protein